MPTDQSKISVLLNTDEHAKIKALAAASRRTMGQELAFLAFAAIRQQKSAKRQPKRSKAA